MAAGEIPVNCSQITDSSGSGFAQPNLSDLVDSLCDGEDQCEPHFSEFCLASRIEELEKELGLADNLENQHRYMVENHVPSQEGGFMISEFSPNPMMGKTTQTPVTCHGQAISVGQQDEVGRKPVKNRRPSKLRMRWTSELHARFVSAVKQLGGCESATPKDIAILMNVPGVNRHHVKSHVQKYRNSGGYMVDSFGRNS